MTAAVIADDLRFPRLPVLETVAARTASRSVIPPRIKVVAVQHLLSTTGSLVEKIIECGVDPRAVFMLGKPYSTHPETAAMLRGAGVHVRGGLTGWRPGQYESWFRREVDALWSEVAQSLHADDRIVVLDDGGSCRRRVPRSIVRQLPIVAIEQTTSGIRFDSPIPVILVAASAAKIEIEPPLVCSAVLKHAQAISRFAAGPIGVIGTGNIGTALVQRLRYDGYDVAAFDSVLARAYTGPARPVRSIRELTRACPMIFGCAGEDVELARSMFRGSESRMLISCSSGDIEFRSLIRSLPSLREYDPLSDLVPEEFDGTLVIRRGGFPVNFDGTAESVPAVDIQLTRGLLFAAFLQACVLLARRPIVENRIMLDPRLQQLVVHRWASMRDAANVVSGYDDVTTIAARSAGVRVRHAEDGLPVV